MARTDIFTGTTPMTGRAFHDPLRSWKRKTEDRECQVCKEKFRAMSGSTAKFCHRYECRQNTSYSYLNVHNDKVVTVEAHKWNAADAKIVLSNPGTSIRDWKRHGTNKKGVFTPFKTRKEYARSAKFRPLLPTNYRRCAECGVEFYGNRLECSRDCFEIDTPRNPLFPPAVTLCEKGTWYLMKVSISSLGFQLYETQLVRMDPTSVMAQAFVNCGFARLTQGDKT